MAGIRSGFLKITACLARGDALCSRPCDDPNALPALSEYRNGKTWELRGCPLKQIPQSVRLFLSDFEKIKDGIMAPYNPTDSPEKFSDMADVYMDWLPYFRVRALKRDNPTNSDGLDLIARARAGML